MSQGIAQQCNDILVLGDLRNGSKLSNYSASSPPICKHDFARRSASASATSLSVSVNGQGVSRGVGTSESLVIACVRFESCLSPRLREGSHRARGHSPPPPFTRCYCSHSLQPPDEGQRHARGASMAPPFRLVPHSLAASHAPLPATSHVAGSRQAVARARRGSQVLREPIRAPASDAAVGKKASLNIVFHSSLLKPVTRA